MENAFYIVACRFHVREKDRLLITGYFLENRPDGNRIEIRLDGKKMFYTTDGIRLHPMKFRKIKKRLITKQFFFWVHLPKDWREASRLEVAQSYRGKEEKMKTFAVSELKKLEKWQANSIDKVNMEEKGFSIEGWYYNRKNASIRFLDENQNELEMKEEKVRRLDVLREYPECKKEEIVGFKAFYEEVVPRKLEVCFEEDERHAEETMNLKRKLRRQKMQDDLRKVRIYYRQFGVRAAFIRAGDKLSGKNGTEYEEWLRRHEPSKIRLYQQKRKKFARMPKISIVVPLYRTPEEYLREMLDSVRRQSYQNWELCLSDGSGEDSPITGILKEYKKKDSRIQVKNNKKQLHISDNTNVALDMATGDYIAFMDHDDLLTPDALYECVAELNEYPDTELIYTDEDKITMDGEEYFFPHFKSDFNLDMLCTTNYFCHLVVVKKELYQAAGKLNGEYDGAQDYDFVLRCVEKTDKIRHIPKILYHWRACEGSTAGSADNKSYIVDAGAKAVRAHYRRMGIEAEVIPTKYPGMYRTKYPVKQTPKISIIIPNKDHTDDLIKCLRSIREKNTYENIEILIVENNSQKKRTFKDYRRIMYEDSRVKVLYWKGEGFNYPEINQYGVDHAAGEYLLFLNNDTEMIGSDCIKEMLSYCMREDVGAVGARMYYEDGTLQHGGVIIGLGGVAGHAFLGIDGDSPGYFARAQVIHDLSAVTAACMMMKKRVYEEVGGFDSKFAVAFNDVDLCLKIRKAGYLIVYDPYAELIHYESKSRGYEDTEEKIERFHGEVNLFQTRWKDFLKKGDPYYSPNLTLDHNDFGLNHLAKVERR